MKLSRVLITTLFASLLVSTSAMAWENCKGSRCDTNCDQEQQGNHLERMAVILDLSADQQQQLEELHAQHQNVRTQMHAEMMTLQQELRDCQPGADSEAMKAKARTYADLKADQLIYNIDFKQQMMAILTPEQQEKATQLKAVQQRRNCTETTEGDRPCKGKRMNNSDMQGHGRNR